MVDFAEAGAALAVVGRPVGGEIQSREVMRTILWQFLAVVIVGVVFFGEATAEEEGRYVPASMVRFDGAVTDYSGALNEHEIARLEAILADHHRSTGVEIGLLILREISTGWVGEHEDFEQRETFARTAAGRWEKWPSSRGDTMLVVVTVDQERSFILREEGIDSVVSAVRAQSILDAAQPALGRERLVEGLHFVVDELIAVTADVDPDQSLGRPFRQRTGLVMSLILILAIFQAFGWRKSRDELYEGKGGAETESKRKPYGLSDLHWWVVPGALVAVSTVGSGNFWIFYTCFWFALALVLAVGIGHAKPAVWTALTLWLVIPLIYSPGQMGMLPAEASEIVVVWIAMIESAFFIVYYIMLGAVIAFLLAWWFIPSFAMSDEERYIARHQRRTARAKRRADRATAEPEEAEEDPTSYW